MYLTFLRLTSNPQPPKWLVQALYLCAERAEVHLHGSRGGYSMSAAWSTGCVRVSVCCRDKTQLPLQSLIHPPSSSWRWNVLSTDKQRKPEQWVKSLDQDHTMSRRDTGIGIRLTANSCLDPRTRWQKLDWFRNLFRYKGRSASSIIQQMQKGDFINRN